MTEDDGHHGVEMRPGTIRASISGQRHAIDFGESGAECVTLHFSDRDMAAHVSQQARDGNSFSSVRGIDDLGRDLVHHASRPQTALLADLDFYELMAAMAACETRDLPDWLEEAKELILGTETPPPPVDVIARQVGVTREHLTRSYQKAYGVAPARARKVSALTRGMGLLAKSDIPLADAAGEAGFYDQAHFSNALRAATGHSPLEMRKCIVEASHFSKTDRAIQ